jgi:hypothetical protein
MLMGRAPGEPVFSDRRKDSAAQKKARQDAEDSNYVLRNHLYHATREGRTPRVSIVAARLISIQREKKSVSTA